MADSAGRGGAGRPDPELLVLAVVVVVAGIAARFVAPTPMWLDEALSVNLAALAPSELFDALGRDGHPPLYYLVLGRWMALFGDGDVAARSLSGVLSLIALVPAWVLGRRRGGPVLGLVFLIVTASAPFALRYATEARMYSLVMLEVLLAALLVDDLVGGRRGWWRPVALALLTGALALTHYWGLLLIAATVTVLAWSAWRHPASRRGVLLAAGSGLAGLVLFLPWAPVMFTQMAETGTPWAPPVRPTAALGATMLDLGGGDVRDAILGAILLGMLGVLGVAGRARGPWSITIDLRGTPGVRVEAAVVGVTLGVGTVVAAVLGSTFVPRYAAVVVPLLLLVVARGVVCFEHRAWRLAVLAAVVGVGLLGAAVSWSTPRTQLGEVATEIAAVAEPGDLVVYCPDQLGPAGERALAQADTAELEQIVYPTGEAPSFVDWTDYEQRNRAADPVAFAAPLIDHPGAVFVVWSPGYETFDGACETLVGELGAARGPGEQLVELDGSRSFEAAALHRFTPPG